MKSLADVDAWLTKLFNPKNIILSDEDWGWIWHHVQAPARYHQDEYGPFIAFNDTKFRKKWEQLDMSKQKLFE